MCASSMRQSIGEADYDYEMYRKIGSASNIYYIHFLKKIIIFTRPKCIGYQELSRLVLFLDNLIGFLINGCCYNFHLTNFKLNPMNFPYILYSIPQSNILLKNY